jgi:MHS family alpha-ketoglutarate permease-like MFS transporter
MSQKTPQTQQEDAPGIRRAVFNTVRGSLGNLVEWYDVYVYTVFASYLSSSFFAEGEPNAGIYTMAIFAARGSSAGTRTGTADVRRSS